MSMDELKTESVMHCSSRIVTAYFKSSPVKKRPALGRTATKKLVFRAAPHIGFRLPPWKCFSVGAPSGVSLDADGNIWEEFASSNSLFQKVFSCYFQVYAS